MNDTQIIAPEKVSTGIAGLDLILKGGLPRHRLFLLEGDPGTGKTTIGLQFLLEGAKRGETVLYITMSESADELKSGAQSHGWSLEAVNICDLTVSGDSLNDDSHYTIFHPSEVELDETTRAVLSEIERLNPERVVFDSLSEMRMLARDSLRFRRQVLALKQYFINKNCTVLMLDDRTAENHDRQLQSIAHGVLHLEYQPADYGKQRHVLRVTKMRGVGFQSGSHDFNIEPGGIRVFPRLEPKLNGDNHLTGVLTSSSADLEQLVGGLHFGTSTIFTGPAGVGKSTLAMIYAFTAAEAGERVAVYLFDETLPTMYARMSALGVDFKRHVESGQILIRQINVSELTPGEFAHLVSGAVEQDGARVVIIDSVNGYLTATPQQQFLIKQFHELLSFLNRKSVITILVVGQHGMVGTMQTPIDMSYLADTVVMMRYFEAAGAVRQAISVLKKRTGKHERTIREYQLGAGGIIIGQPLTEFQGVLTGVPVFRGESGELMNKNASR